MPATSVNARAFLNGVVSQGFSRSDAADIISFLSGMPYKEVIPNLDRIAIKSTEAEKIGRMLSDGIPVAYITGRKEFYGREFLVDRSVLIPRPETETLIDTVLSNYNRNAELKIVDLCTGSGCILLTLLKELPDARGIGVDISQEALDMAGRNALRLDVADRAEFLRYNVLEDLPVSGADIITVNPPYLSREEYAAAPRSLLFEPELALTAGEDGYLFYKKLLCSLSKLGNNNALAFFEVGYTQSAKVMELASSHGYRWNAVRDTAGHQRVVWGVAVKGAENI